MKLTSFGYLHDGIQLIAENEDVFCCGRGFGLDRVRL